jgi:hypothetical protein
MAEDEYDPDALDDDQTQDDDGRVVGSEMLWGCRMHPHAAVPMCILGRLGQTSNSQL